ncbi:MAG: spore coat protein [Armatimonadota bacterium]|nr:spore coat protein [Armatimonadota bacterium]
MEASKPETPFQEAHQRALAEGRPQVVPLRYFADDRGWSLMNLFTGVLQGGQCNYSLLYPGVYKAWHRHKLQTDFWVILHGMAKLGVFDEKRRDEPGYRGETFILGEKQPAVLIVPPSLWHGLTCVGNQPCGLLYYVTHVYDPRSPDEERAGHDAFPSFQWDIEHK